jgi:hypothetical protein
MAAILAEVLTMARQPYVNSTSIIRPWHFLA